MATSSVGSTLDPSLTGSTATAPANRFSELTSSDFVKIMFTELTNQDPLKPNDSNTLLQQFSSLRSIEANLSLETKLNAVVSQGQLSTAGSLLGKYVGGYTDNFSPAEGYVNSISQTSSGPVLNLSDGSRVPFKNVQQIYDPTNGTTDPTTPPATTPPTTTPPATTPPVVPLFVPPSTTPLVTNPTTGSSQTGQN